MPISKGLAFSKEHEKVILNTLCHRLKITKSCISSIRIVAYSLSEYGRKITNALHPESIGIVWGWLDLMREIMHWTKIWKQKGYFWPWPLTSIKVTAHPLSKGSLWVKYEPDWTKGRGDMLQTSAMTLTLDLETCFKVTTHPLHKGTL